YYITVMNENYAHPGMREGDEEGIIRGLYRLKEGGTGKLRVQLLGSGTLLREVIAAQELLEQDWGVSADVWSATSFTELRRDGLDCERYNLLHPESKTPHVTYVTQMLEQSTGPIVASTRCAKSYADQNDPLIPPADSYRVLGTDGYRCSDF